MSEFKLWECIQHAEGNEFGQEEHHIETWNRETVVSGGSMLYQGSWGRRVDRETGRA